MDARTATRRRAWPSIDGPVSARLAWAVAVAMLAVLALLAILACARRLTGSLATPLPAPTLWACAGFLALSAAAFRATQLRALPGTSRAMACVLWSAASIILAMWGVALTFRETSTSGLIGLWAILFLAEGWSWGRLLQDGIESHGIAASVTTTGRVAAPLGIAVVNIADEALDEGVSQQLIRRRQEDGSEAMEGWVRVALAPGQRHANAHLAICPPFDHMPQCFAEQMDGPPAQVKVAQVLPYGVRLEIKLDNVPKSAVEVSIEFSLQEQIDDA